MARARAKNLKDQLEAAVGHKLAVDAVERLGFARSPVGSYVTTESETFTSWRSLIEVSPKLCQAARLLDASGWGITGADGQSAFRLSDFVCSIGPQTTEGTGGTQTPSTLMPPINVVATPHSSTPCFITSQYSFINDQADVEITLSTWDPNGAAAPDIAFDWRCRVVVLPGY